MEAPQNVAKARTKTARNRAGCLTCRRRKVKCDEESPTCRRCRDGNRECSYPAKVTWHQLRGANLEILPNQVIEKPRKELENGLPKVPSNDAPLDSLCIIDTSIEDFEHHGPRIAESVSQPSLLGIAITPDSQYIGHSSIPVGPSPFQIKMTDSELKLLNFYVNGMCPKCVLRDGRNNSYRDIVVPVSLHSELLLKAVLAASANWLRSREPEWGCTAVRYYHDAMASFRNVLGTDPKLLPRTEILGTILMLCFFDMDAQSAWVNHAHGARQLMELPLMQLPRASIMDQALSSFLGQYFACRTILTYTAVRDETNEKPLSDNAEFWLTKVLRPSQEINCFIGCSNELVHLILVICQQIRMRNIPKQPWKDIIRTRIQNLHQVRQVSLSSQQNSTLPVTNTASSSTTAEAFRLATLILLEHADSLGNPNKGLVKAYVESILRLMRPLPIPGPAAKCSSVWPLFIAACHVTDEENRIVVTRIMDDMEKKEGFSATIRSVRQIIKHLWKHRELEKYNTRKANDHKGHRVERRIFDWEKVMAYKNWDITWA